MLNLSEFIKKFGKVKLGVLGLAILIGHISVAVFGDYFVGDPFHVSGDVFVGPSIDHPMGTDHLGRDVFSRVICGSMTSLFFGLGVAGMALILGVVMGSIPAYLGGAVDDLFMRVTEMFMMLPSLFLIILMVAFFGQNLVLTMFIVGLTLWPSNARIMRSQVLNVKHSVYVQSAKGIGAGTFRILTKHIIPNCIAPVITNASLTMGYAVILEANLSFLGLGDVNFVSWGQILKAARGALFAWWLLVFPAVAIVSVVFSFNAISDALNKVINPKLRERW